MAVKQHPVSVVIFYNGSDDNDPSQIVVQGTYVAPSLDVAKILAVLDLPEEYQAAEKVARLEFAVNFLA